MRKILRGHVFTKSLFTLCLGLSFLIEAHAQVSGTFTINSAVATGGSNFQTFSAAAAFLSSGVNGPVIFNVQAGSGPYNEQVILNNITGTSATNTITFNCNNVTLTFLSTNSNNRGGIKLNGADYVIFDNLTVLPQADDFGEYGYAFHLINDADHNTIKNCHITLAADWNAPENHQGIVINGNNAEATDPGDSKCDDNLIQGNTIYGGTMGITLSSKPVGSNPAVFMTGNKIRNNTISNTLYYGIQMYYNDGTVIDANDISGGPDAIYGSTGIYLVSFNQSVTITNNRIHAFHAISGLVFGMLITSESVAGKPITIANNLIYDFQSVIAQYGIASRDANSGAYSGSYLNIYHNTISLDDQVEFGTETYGVYLEFVTDVDVKDNIVTITRNGSDFNYGIFFASVPQRTTSDRNVFYIPAGHAPLCALGKYNGIDYINLPNWNSATGYDYFSSNFDPAYTNLASFNFVPTKQSIDNMGVYVNINTDIAGTARNTTFPDPGCYEFVSPPCTAPPIAGQLVVTPDTVLCQGPTISLFLNGNSAGGGQTYVWQTSTTATGTYTNVTGPQAYPFYNITPTTTQYYRVALTCGTSTVFSNPVRVLVTAPLNAGTYTINAALPTNGINFTSFKDAILALGCGFNGHVVFNVISGSGPYNEQVIIPVINSSPTKTITFNGNGETVAYTPTNLTQCAVIKLEGADYITLDSLTVNVGGISNTGFGIQLKDDADHNTVKRCTVNISKTTTDSLHAGIVINPSENEPANWVTESYCDSNLIANNKVNGGYFGITCTSKSLAVGFSASEGNIIRNNTLNDVFGFGIYISGTSNTLVDSNDISHPTRTVFSGDPFTGIYAYQSNFGLTISRNRIHNLLEKAKNSLVDLQGISIEEVIPPATKTNIVSNNLLYNFYGNGTHHGLSSLFSNDVKFYHNTVSLEDTSSATVLATRGIALFGTTTLGLEFKNNNIVVRRGGTGAKYCIYLNANDSSIKADYNNYYLLGAKGTSNYIGRMGSKNYANLSNWLATRKDTNSVSIDPVFFDPVIGNYTPTKIPFENKGSYIGIASDIVNVTRNTTNPDIGAIEFTICRQLTTPVLSVDSSGVNALKFSWTAVQNTTGYRISRDGINWTIPSSGAFGTSHTITGLKPTDTIGLMVKALGTRVDCPEYFSQRLVGQALADGIFIPNTFTPNGNGQDDVFKVYTNVMSSIHWMVFNQWGEKVFETSDKDGKWDGSYKGKPQPIGVYIYVVSGTLADGTKVTKKGSFNLIR